MRIALVSSLALGALAFGFPAAAQVAPPPPPPFSIDDLLAQEDFGAVRISPDGRWIVIERQAPWNSASTYRYGMQTAWMLSSLEVAPSAGDGPPRTIGDSREGLVAGPFSPNGERMAIYGLSGQGLRLGVLTLADGSIRWLPVTPETPRYGRALQWRSDTLLVSVVRPDDSLPILLRFGLQTQSRQGELWEAAANGGTSAVWIPSGEDRDTRARSQPQQLVEFDLVSGSRRVLAQGEFIDLELSADGRSAALLRNAEDIQDGSPDRAEQGDPTRRRRLVIVDLEDGTVIEPLPEEDFITHLLAWSPDGSGLLAYSRPDGGTFEDGGFRLIRRDGRVRPLATSGGRPWIDRTPVMGFPVVYGGWAGNDPLVQLRTQQGERIWSTAAGRLPALAGDTLVRLDRHTVIQRATGLVAVPGGRVLVEGAPAGTGSAGDAGDRGAINPTAGPAPVLVNREGCLVRASATAALPRCPVPPAAGETRVVTSPDGRFFVGRSRSPGGATALTLHTAERASALASINGRLEGLGWGEIWQVRHPGPDGQELSSWLLMPPAGVRAGPPPVVVYLYPGRDNRTAPAWLRPGGDRRHLNPAVLASAGYAVLVPSLPEPWSGVRDRDGLAQTLLAIVAAAGAEADLDTSRIALVGHSFGAYGALLAASQSDRFSAVVATNGYADLSTSTELPPPWRLWPEDGVPVRGIAGWSESGQAGLGVSFAGAPLDYAQRSPLYAASRITAPVLLIESDLDHQRYGVLFSALYRQDRNAALLTYYGESHALASPGNLRDMHRRILDWLARWLEPGGPRQAILPQPDPGLQQGEDEEAVAFRVPDEGVGLQTGRHLLRTDQTRVGQPPPAQP